MAKGGFFEKPFDEGTLTKLDIVQLYVREWLPVFLAPTEPAWTKLHVFDFLAGPGVDTNDVPGSPLRILEELRRAKGGNWAGWPKTRLSVHFFDRDPSNASQLLAKSAPLRAKLSDISVEIEPWDFNKSFTLARPALLDRDAAKLVLIDQFGVDLVSEEVFKELVSFPTCDFLFFISSSILHRFHDHPAIKQKIVRPKDHYHVHRAVVEYYRGLLPKSIQYYLGHFSLKKGANIYGIIFGAAHPRGIDKFLQVAWKKNAMNGEADYDVDRDNFGPLSTLLQPTKVLAFQDELETLLLQGKVRNEREAMEVCYRHGVKRQHAAEVLKKLKLAGSIECDFRVPAVERYKKPRPIRLVDSDGT